MAKRERAKRAMAKRANGAKGKGERSLYELGGLMQIARIARPGALYGASVSARTFEEAGHAVLNMGGFKEIVDVNSTKATDNIQHPHINRLSEFLAKMSKYANVVNLHKSIIRA